MRRLALPVALGALVLLSGMAISLWWPWSTVHGSGGHYWSVPSDIWDTFRNSQFASWGALPYIYNHHGYWLNGLPGMAILMAPVTLLADHLGLTMSAPWIGVWLRHPTAWLLIGPFVLACNAVLLLAIDRFIVGHGVEGARRRYVLLVAAALSWPTTAWWGHPEDVLALAGIILVLAWVAEGRRTVATGWVVGASVALQPLTLLILPIVVLMQGWRTTKMTSWRAAVIPMAVVATPLAINPGPTWSTLFHQQSFPNWPNHPTPWIYVAGGTGSTSVGAGPNRVAILALTVGIGFAARRWAIGRPDTAMWFGAICCGLRCALEPVMCTYYVMPVAVLACLASMKAGVVRLSLVIALAGFLTAVAGTYASPWTWYLQVMALMVALVAVSRPRRFQSEQRVDDAPDTRILELEIARRASLEIPKFVFSRSRLPSPSRGSGRLP